MVIDILTTKSKSFIFSFAEQSNIKFELGLIKNNDTPFIEIFYFL